MPKIKHLIIGSGPAAVAAAAKIRKLRPEDGIRMVSREDSLPYNRAVLPYLLNGQSDGSSIWLQNEASLHSSNISYTSGKEVKQIIKASKQVVYADGGIDNFDTLLIAAGASPVMPAGLALNNANLLRFHSLDDYHRLNAALDDGKDVAVLGAGMIGLGLAIVLAENGARVRVVEKENAILSNYFDENVSIFVRDTLIQNGLDIVLGSSVTGIERNAQKTLITLSNGNVIRADVVAACLGVKPNLSFINNSEINTNQGILVDNRMRTSVPDIYAAGDIAESPDFFHGRCGISAILPNAIAQGKTAGANMAGGNAISDGWIGMNLLKFFGNTAFSIGQTAPSDGAAEILQRADIRSGHFKRLVIKDSNLHGALFLNTEIDPGIIRYLIENRVDIKAHANELFDRPLEVSRWLMLRNEKGVPV